MAVYKSSRPTKDGRLWFYRVKYKDVFGVKHDYSSQKYKTKKEAESDERLFLINLSKNKDYSNDPTVSNVFDEYIVYKSKLNKKQSIGKERNLFRYLSPLYNKRIGEINLVDYKKFYSYVYALPYSSDHRTRILQLLKRLIIYSSKYYGTSDSLVKYIEPIVSPGEIKKEMDFYTYDEFKKFISVVDDVEFRVLMNVLYFCGIRIGEALGLQWKDVDLVNKTILINKTATTKLGEFYTLSAPKTKSSIRLLPISDHLTAEFEVLRSIYINSPDYGPNSFVFGLVRPMPESTVTNKKNHYCDVAGLRRIRIHDFRHSFASLMLNNGASIMLVSKYLGHSNISITLNTYTHLYQSEIVKMIDVINKLE